MSTSSNHQINSKRARIPDCWRTRRKTKGEICTHSDEKEARLRRFHSRALPDLQFVAMVDWVLAHSLLLGEYSDSNWAALTAGGYWASVVGLEGLLVLEVEGHVVVDPFSVL